MVVRLILAAAAHVQTNDWEGDPVVWILFAVFLGIGLIGGYLLVRQPWADRKRSQGAPVVPHRDDEDN